MPICFLTIPADSVRFLSIATDELKVKPHHHMAVTTAALAIHKPALIYFRPVLKTSMHGGK